MGKAWDGKAIKEEAAKPWNAEGHMRLTGSPDSKDRKLIHRSGSAYRNRAGAAGKYDLSPKGNYAFQEWTEQWAAEAFRLLKPGGYLLSFSSTRTYHRMVCGIEDAGFEIRDTLMWIQGQGFPKSLNLEGGLGTALKPSFEPIVLARKPVEGTVSQNVERHGTGALNISATRIETSEQPAAERRKGKPRNIGVGNSGWDVRGSAEAYSAPHEGEDIGRWPSNVLLSHTEQCEHVGTRTTEGRTIRRPVEKMLPFGGGKGKEYDTIEFPPEENEVWECADGCPVREIDEQSGSSTSRSSSPRAGKSGNGWGMTATGAEYDDTGGASRFFYRSKVSVAERNAGCPKGTSIHPTMKPIDLMRWLCRLTTPHQGVVLDPFLGSGTTAIAAHLEGLDFIGIERELPYMQIAEARINWWIEHGEDGLRITAQQDAKNRVAVERRQELVDLGQMDLFDAL